MSVVWERNDVRNILAAAMTKASGYSTLTGSLGIVCMGSPWLALLAPERVDAFLRPYGLYVWFGAQLAGVILPTIAALLGSKLWLFVTALGVTSLVIFSRAVLS
jgi:hypothetical protein